MLTEEQKKIRMNGVGASDVPIITGHSTFCSAYELYKLKRGELIPKEAGIKADAGTFLEDGIAALFTHQTGIKTFKAPETIYHPDYSFILCHLDRTIRDGIPFEIKNTTMADMWGDPLYGPESIPTTVHIQVQMQMSCTGSKMAFVACLLFGYDLRIYEIPRDNQLIEMLIGKIIAFWRCVKEGKPPPIQYNHPTTSEMLRRVYRGTNGKIIDLPAEALDWHEKKVEESAIAKQHDTIAKGYETRIRKAMGDNAVGLLSDGTGYTRKKNKKGNILMNHTKHPPRDNNG
jgi:putative phage-type endonuclease